MTYIFVINIINNTIVHKNIGNTYFVYIYLHIYIYIYIYLYMSYDIGIHSQSYSNLYVLPQVLIRASECFDRSYIHVYKSLCPCRPPELQTSNPPTTSLLHPTKNTSPHFPFPTHTFVSLSLLIALGRKNQTER